MLPITFIKTIKKTSLKHHDLFADCLANRIIKFEFKKKDRCAIGIPQKTCVICEQPNKLKKAPKSLPEISTNHVIKLNHYRKNKNTLANAIKNKGVFTSFGIGGW